MSRSNPSERTPHPCTRWLEWHGTEGYLKYFDKATEQRVVQELPFKFLLLDELNTVAGFHKKLNSRIYANEVRDTVKDPLVVKVFDGPTIAEGVYRQIEPAVKAVGGRFCKSCYIAYKKDDEYALGNLALTGAAFSAWLNFKADHAAEVYAKAIEITGYTEGKTGNVTYRAPVFGLIKTVSADAESAARALDAVLQGYLAGYLKRSSEDQVESTPAAPAPITEDDIPF